MNRLRSFDSRISSSLAIIAIAATLVGLPTSAIAAESPIDLALYARLLDAHTRVSDDIVAVRVDYRKIGMADGWSELVSQVESARPSQLDRDEQIAFWVNAYNILTIAREHQGYRLVLLTRMGHRSRHDRGPTDQPRTDRTRDPTPDGRTQNSRGDRLRLDFLSTARTNALPARSTRRRSLGGNAGMAE